VIGWERGWEQDKDDGGLEEDDGVCNDVAGSSALSLTWIHLFKQSWLLAPLGYILFDIDLGSVHKCHFPAG